MTKTSIDIVTLNLSSMVLRVVEDLMLQTPADSVISTTWMFMIKMSE